MKRLRAKLKSRFENWREWEMNPVLVKELRQATRNRVLVSMLMFLLAGLFLVMLSFLVTRDFLMRGTDPIGLDLSRAFLAILTVISLIFVPLYAGIQFTIEREQASFELLLATALPGWKIIRGKFLSAAYIQLMFFSVFFPFLAAATLLRGVDWPAVLFSLVCLYILVCVAAQAAIALACSPMYLIGKIVLGLLFAALLVGASAGLLLFFSGMLQSGVGTLMASVGFWLCFLGFLAVSIWAYVIFYAFSISFAVRWDFHRHYCDVLKNGPAILREQSEPIEAFS